VGIASILLEPHLEGAHKSYDRQVLRRIALNHVRLQDGRLPDKGCAFAFLAGSFFEPEDSRSAVRDELCFCQFRHASRRHMGQRLKRRPLEQAATSCCVIFSGREI
jgi:hypothetical protein